MEQIACKKCTSPDCHGCNLLRLEQILKSGKLDALMDEKRGIKTGIDVRPVVRAEWKIYHKTNIAVCKCCSYQYMMGAPWHEYPPRFCPNCGADMREES